MVDWHLTNWVNQTAVNDQIRLCRKNASECIFNTYSMPYDKQSGSIDIIASSCKPIIYQTDTETQQVYKVVKPFTDKIFEIQALVAESLYLKKIINELCNNFIYYES